MRHQLSVTGDVASLYAFIPDFDGITAEGDSRKIVFSAYTDRNYEKLKEKLVCHISDIIIEKHEDRWLNKIIKSSYKYLTPDERRSIIGIIKKEKTPGNTAEKKAYIEEKLREFMPYTGTIMVDGFINFRLYDYKKRLAHEVEMAVDSFWAQREYEEFIKLIRYFIETQKQREEVVHVFPKENGTYILCNKKFKEITAQSDEEIAILLEEEGLNFDDLMLSTLITLAPEKIIIHNREIMKNVQLADTITQIFRDNALFCTGCSKCRK